VVLDLVLVGESEEGLEAGLVEGSAAGLVEGLVEGQEVLVAGPVVLAVGPVVLAVGPVVVLAVVVWEVVAQEVPEVLVGPEVQDGEVVGVEDNIQELEYKWVEDRAVE
jgi:hypothetical protein